MLYNFLFEFHLLMNYYHYPHPSPFFFFFFFFLIQNKIQKQANKQNKEQNNNKNKQTSPTKSSKQHFGVSLTFSQDCSWKKTAPNNAELLAVEVHTRCNWQHGGQSLKRQTVVTGMCRYCLIWQCLRRGAMLIYTPLLTLAAVRCVHAQCVRVSAMGRLGHFAD